MQKSTRVKREPRSRRRGSRRPDSRASSTSSVTSSAIQLVVDMRRAARRCEVSTAHACVGDLGRRCRSRASGRDEEPHQRHRRRPAPAAARPARSAGRAVVEAGRSVHGQPQQDRLSAASHDRARSARWSTASGGAASFCDIDRDMRRRRDLDRVADDVAEEGVAARRGPSTRLPLRSPRRACRMRELLRAGRTTSGALRPDGVAVAAGAQAQPAGVRSVAQRRVDRFDRARR